MTGIPGRCPVLMNILPAAVTVQQVVSDLPGPDEAAPAQGAVQLVQWRELGCSMPLAQSCQICLVNQHFAVVCQCRPRRGDPAWLLCLEWVPGRPDLLSVEPCSRVSDT